MPPPVGGLSLNRISSGRPWQSVGFGEVAPRRVRYRRMPAGPLMVRMAQTTEAHGAGAAVASVQAQLERPTKGPLSSPRIATVVCGRFIGKRCASSRSRSADDIW